MSQRRTRVGHQPEPGLMGSAARLRSDESAHQAHPQTLHPLPECRLSSFKDLAHLGPDGGILKPAAHVMEMRWRSDSWLGARSDNHLVDISVDDQVCVVRDDDDLPVPACLAEESDQLSENRFRVKVLLGLIDDQRPGILKVQGEVQEQQDDAARARRKLRNLDALVLDAVVNPDVVRGVDPAAEVDDPP